MAQIIKKGLDADCDLTRFAPAIKAAGFSHVGRYLKNVTRSEIAACHAAGLGMWFIFEGSAERALEGSVAGSQDGAKAAAQAVELGLPARTCIFTTCDTDPTNGQVPYVISYGSAFGAALGSFIAGFYACGAVLTASKLIPWLAGASGWNGSKVYAPSGTWAMQQGPDLNGHAASWAGIEWPALDIDYDPNLIAREDFGLWLPPALSQTSPVGTATPTQPTVPSSVSASGTSQSATTSGVTSNISVPPVPPVPNKKEILKQWQSFLGVSPDGVCGPNTLDAFEDFFS